MTIAERIQKQLDAGNYTVGVLADLKKAFNTVNHNTLLEKLHYYGIRGVAKDRFRSYLDNTKQYVTLNGSNSSIKTILTGVNVNVLSILKPIILLMTPICFSHIVYTLETLAKQMNLDLKHLSQWLKANILSLNVTKTELIIFHSSSKKTDPSHKYFRWEKINTNWHSKIPWSPLRWSLTMVKTNHVATTPNQAIGFLSKLRSRASLKILKMTYHFLFCSHLLYGSQLWDQSNITNQNKIQKLQNRALRKIMFKKSKILLVKYTRN